MSSTVGHLAPSREQVRARRRRRRRAVVRAAPRERDEGDDAARSSADAVARAMLQPITSRPAAALRDHPDRRPRASGTTRNRPRSSPGSGVHGRSRGPSVGLVTTVDAARTQFALLAGIHFLFVLVTLGLGPVVAIFQTRWAVTRREVHERATRFWGQLYLVNYALGIVAGILLELQFGLHFPGLLDVAGEVFGAPLAVETMVAFFLESTLLGLWVFGWHQLNRWVHTVVFWLVVLTGYASAFAVMVANGFLRHPVGYELRRRRRAHHRRRRARAQPRGRPVARARHRRVPAGRGVRRRRRQRVAPAPARRGLDELFQRSLRTGVVVGAVGALLAVGFGFSQFSYFTDGERVGAVPRGRRRARVHDPGRLRPVPRRVPDARAHGPRRAVPAPARGCGTVYGFLTARAARAVRARDPRLADARDRPPAVGRRRRPADLRRHLRAQRRRPCWSRSAVLVGLIATLAVVDWVGARAARPPRPGRPHARRSTAARPRARRAPDLRGGVPMTLDRAARRRVRRLGRARRHEPGARRHAAPGRPRPPASAGPCSPRSARSCWPARCGWSPRPASCSPASRDLERDLWFVAYPLVIALLVTWVLRDAGVWLRSRRPGVALAVLLGARGRRRVRGAAAVGRRPARRPRSCGSRRSRRSTARVVVPVLDRPVRRRRHARARHHLRRHPDLRASCASAPPASAGRDAALVGGAARRGGDRVRRPRPRRRSAAPPSCRRWSCSPGPGPPSSRVPRSRTVGCTGRSLAVVVGGALPVVAAAIALAPAGRDRAPTARARAARLRAGAARRPGVGLVDVPAPGRPARRGLLLTDPSALQATSFLVSKP